ncbi:hypothetical protein [Actinacidiphila sp. bgisy160]|uniref:hypothetical protein n=1 Tax=Actinacidiphila sp. bgisy160 TaxID=3413796 RepID=UPI003D717409
MLRHRARPRFTIGPRIAVVPLVDIRPDAADAADPLLHEPAPAFPVPDQAPPRPRHPHRVTEIGPR